MAVDEEWRRGRLKPGPKRVGPRAYLRPPPGVTTQKTFRAEPELLEAVEERALKETLLTGKPVRFSELVRRGIGLMLAEPLPPGRLRGRRRCQLAPTTQEGLYACLGCRKRVKEACE